MVWLIALLPIILSWTALLMTTPQTPLVWGVANQNQAVAIKVINILFYYYQFIYTFMMKIYFNSHWLSKENWMKQFLVVFHSSKLNFQLQLLNHLFLKLTRTGDREIFVMKEIGLGLDSLMNLMIYLIWTYTKLLF